MGLCTALFCPWGGMGRSGKYLDFLVPRSPDRGEPQVHLMERTGHYLESGLWVFSFGEGQVLWNENEAQIWYPEGQAMLTVATGRAYEPRVPTSVPGSLVLLCD